ncbi:hypothetical protein QUA20_08060 [Microcoleus sp. Pol7_A1]|uniref:hypothetical protein n=1 Tax=Microcoleus sp. Pol7_A1 TaxID=2818893 RepID=UPI002FD21E69
MNHPLSIVIIAALRLVIGFFYVGWGASIIHLSFTVILKIPQQEVGVNLYMGPYDAHYLFRALGAYYIVLGLSSIVLSLRIWKRKKWSWKGALALSAIDVCLQIIDLTPRPLIHNYIMLGLGLSIIVYLVKQKKVDFVFD